MPGQSAEGSWHLTGEEWFFPGHFPGRPTLPGVLMCEAVAQLGAVAVLTDERYAGRLPLFGGLDGARFRRQVGPGDTLELSVAARPHVGARRQGQGPGQPGRQDGVRVRADVRDRRPVILTERAVTGVVLVVSLPPFQRLVDAHATGVHRYLVAAVGREDAADCFQETFLAALRAYPALRSDENLRGWLFTIARNKALDSHRARGPAAGAGRGSARGRAPRRRRREQPGVGRRASATRAATPRRAAALRR